MKLLKSFLYSAALAVTLPAIVSCDSGPLDPSDGALDFDLARFDEADLIANPSSLASMPFILKEGDVFTFNQSAINRADEDINLIPYETTWNVNNTRQVLLFRRPPGFEDISIQPRSANWEANEDELNRGMFKTIDLLDNDRLQDIIDKALNGPPIQIFNQENLQQALANDGDPVISEPEAEIIEDSFQALGIEAFNNFGAPTIKATLKREVRFTADSSNADTLNLKEITGTYEIIEFSKSFKFTVINDEPYMEPSFVGDYEEQVAESGEFILKLNGLTAN